jgi:hypothetical protein
MSRSAVKEILHAVDALDDADRIKLEQELARRLERQWRQESKKARKTARRRKIGQPEIDRAIELRRYGRCRFFFTSIDAAGASNENNANPFAPAIN